MNKLKENGFIKIETRLEPNLSRHVSCAIANLLLLWFTTRFCPPTLLVSKPNISLITCLCVFRLLVYTTHNTFSKKITLSQPTKLKHYHTFA
ncbi:hypothetical protein HanRHA438_Chr15g0696791 [Helianthus annuus]|nr:hypothetical protein HanRHA438_Chr15g0696791 [Helianthus annuus]